jgi:hypothetical protein
MIKYLIFSLQLRRWRKYVLLKHWYLPSSPHSISTQKTTIDIKMTVFWDTAPLVWQKLTDVSEVLTASIIRAMSNDGGSMHL